MLKVSITLEPPPPLPLSRAVTLSSKLSRSSSTFPSCVLCVLSAVVCSPTVLERVLKLFSSVEISLCAVLSAVV